MPSKTVTPEAEAVRALIEAADQVDTLLVGGLPHPTELAQIVASIHDQRARLAQVADFLTDRLGKEAGAIQGNLPDGRQFTVKRTADRKEWQHDEWKRDARRRIAQDLASRYVPQSDDDPVAAIIDTETGEEVTMARVLLEAMAAIQDVHGSTSPKSTALKALGLYASDYCTSTPGGWRMNVIRPESTLTSDTKES